MKVWNYIVIMIGVIVAFHIMGIGVEGQSSIFNITGTQINESGTGIGQFESNTFSLSDFFLGIFSTTLVLGILGGLGIAALGGVVTGLTGGRYSVENFIILPFITGVLVLFGQVFVGIINNAVAGGQAWIIGVIMMLVLPFFVGFIVALVEFFRGTD